MRRLLLLLGLLLLLTALLLQSPHNGPAGAAGVDRTRPALLDCTGEKGVSAKQMRQAQQAWARYLGCKVEESVEIGKGVKMTFVLVPPGKFKMGSPENEERRCKDETLHTVTLTKPFYLGKYEVMQEQYEALTGSNSSEFQGASLPVERVSWEEARDCAAKLTAKRSDKSTYRLPSEAEWEYACRGGRPSSQPFGIGDGHSLSCREANFYGPLPYGDADKGPNREKTSPVGAFKANALGLYDMHGNVGEWCGDWDGSYPVREATNPTGPSEGSARVFRGGEWGHDGSYCRAAARFRYEPGGGLNFVGFRLARSIPAVRK